MAGIRYKGQIFSGVPSAVDANDVVYDNTESGLTAGNVQDVIDELYSKSDGPYLKTDDFVTQTYREQYSVGPSVINWSIYGAIVGYTAKSYTFFHSNCTTVKAGVEGVSLSNSSFSISGFARTIDGSTAPTTNFWVQILWVKNV